MFFAYILGSVKRSVVVAGICAAVLGGSMAAHAQDITSPLGGTFKVGQKFTISFENAPANSSTNISISYAGPDGPWTNIGSSPVQAGTSGHIDVFGLQPSTNAYIVCVDFNPPHAPLGTPVGPLTFWWNDSVKFNFDGPVSGTTWHQDSSYPVSWTVENSDDNAPDFIKLTLNVAVGGGTGTVMTKILSTTLDHSSTGYNFKVPRTPTAQAQLVVTTADGKAQSALSPKFKIAGAAVTLDFPKKGNFVYSGMADTIRWSVTGPNGGSDTVLDGPITLYYWTTGVANKYVKIDSLIPAKNRQYIWMPPDPGAVGKNAVLRLSADSGFIALQSDTFRLQQAPTVVAESPLLPELTLDQNYPNPFSASFDNSITTVPFTLAHAANIGLRVFDLLGRTVAQTGVRHFEAGRFTLPFDATGLMPGIYGYEFTGGISMSRMMMYVR